MVAMLHFGQDSIAHGRPSPTTFNGRSRDPRRFCRRRHRTDPLPGACYLADLGCPGSQPKGSRRISESPLFYCASACTPALPAAYGRPRATTPWSTFARTIRPTRGTGRAGRRNCARAPRHGGRPEAVLSCRRLCAPVGPSRGRGAEVAASMPNRGPARPRGPSRGAVVSPERLAARGGPLVVNAGLRDATGKAQLATAPTDLPRHTPRPARPAWCNRSSASIHDARLRAA